MTSDLDFLSSTNCKGYYCKVEMFRKAKVTNQVEVNAGLAKC